MSSLQFQKQIRLQEAWRLLLDEDVDAATAGYLVGYDDASHFSREYKRLFDKPPVRDVEGLRGAVAGRTDPAARARASNARPGVPDRQALSR